MNDLNATLNGGPHDGLETHTDRPTLDIPQLDIHATVIGWHEYRAINDKRTDYEYTGYRARPKWQLT